MSKYSLGNRSLSNLKGVHPDLVKVVKRAIQLTSQDFTVIEGLRSTRRQADLVRKGFSKTMNSRHITGHAVDIIPYPIPRDWDRYQPSQWLNIEEAMKKAAKELDVDLQWGGDWKSFIDRPHWQLSRGRYR